MRVCLCEYVGGVNVCEYVHGGMCVCMWCVCKRESMCVYVSMCVCEYACMWCVCVCAYSVYVHMLCVCMNVMCVFKGY